VIPDVAAAVESPHRVPSDLTRAWRLLALVPEVPVLTWGRDELGTRRHVELQLPDLRGSSSAAATT
jgi:hypothetical protein